MYEVSLVKPSVSVGLSWSATADRSLPLPAYATDGAAGMDVCANFAEDQRAGGAELAPMARQLIPTGLILQIPVGYEVQMRPRSGLALKSGITLANSPGTIDSDYRGEVGIILVNLSDTPFRVSHGDRVAQMVFAPVTRCDWRFVESPNETPRGSGGFGSTGVLGV